MDYFDFSFCNNCDNLVKFKIAEEMISEEYKGEIVNFLFNIGKCDCCNSEVATDIDYNSRKSKAKIEAYKSKLGIITLAQINELLNMYGINEEELEKNAGFKKGTIQNYIDGVIPSKESSDILLSMLNGAGRDAD